MRRKPASARQAHGRRARPVIEGLEGRRLLSTSSTRQAVAASSASGGAFSRDDRAFTYVTPTGGTAEVQVVGRGNLAGSTVNSSGALQLVFNGTNAFTKINGSVHGGGGHAPLASILSGQLIAAGAQNSLSGIGGTVLKTVDLGSFDLVAGGDINLTPGVSTLVLNSIGPDTQVHLRALPPPPVSTTSVSVVTSPVLISSITATGVTTAVVTEFGTTTTTSTSGETTLEAGQSGTVSSPYDTTTTYVSNEDRAQTLTATAGTFTSAGNIVEPLPTGQPPQTVPPAPPGVILKVNHISGSTAGPINLLTDPRIFGYDPTTGQVVRFALNLTNDTGAIDPAFTPINVPGDPAVAGVDIAWDGSTLDVLVSSGTTVYAYNATTGAPVGSFTTSVPINSIGSTDTITVLGSYQTNSLEAINLPASLASGTAQPALGDPQPFIPQAEFTFLGGLTGAPGTEDIYATIAAHLDTTQPNQTQLGSQTISTVDVAQNPSKGTPFTYKLASVGFTALHQNGAYVNVQPDPLDLTQPGPALGSIDGTLALVSGLVDGANIILNSHGQIKLTYPDLLTSLSQSFRPDIAGSALIDVQGTLQTIRGDTATGMVVNDSGNLNLIKFQRLTNSTIVGQPIGHLKVQSRSNVTVLTPSRTVGTRNGVTIDPSLRTIGPLSQPND